MALSTLDTVRALGMELPGDGGTQTVGNPTAINTLQDALAAAGFFVDGPSVTAADKSTYVDRTTSGMRFTDAFAAQQLSNVVGAARGGSQYHGALPDIVHWLPDGPGDGVASGATLVVNLSGPLATSQIWYASSSLQTKLFSIAYSYPAGSPLPSTVTYTLYTNNAAARVITDAVTYSGAIETGRTRTYS